MLLEKSTSAVMTLDLKTGRFKRQATLPDLPLCSTKVTPCSPNSSDSKAIGNYAAWGPDGALYITDYGQAVIWRLPAKGGTPKVWFASSALDNVPRLRNDWNRLPAQQQVILDHPADRG